MPFLAPVLVWIFGAGVLPWVIRSVLRIICGFMTFGAFKAFVLPSFFSVGFIVALFNGLPQGVYYFFRISAVPEGIALCFSAYVAAWVMNKITKACSTFV